jgi:excinuclease ABC subunit B
LRSARSLIQTIGRAARNVNGEVIMYADRITAAMKLAMDETIRRRSIQSDYNKLHGISPETTQRAIMDFAPNSGQNDYYAVPRAKRTDTAGKAPTTPEEVADRALALRQEMFAAAEALDFERAARLRDELRQLDGGSLEKLPAPASKSARPAARKRR